MNEQTVEGVADADAARLGVVDDGLAHLQVAVLVEVGVHHAGTRLDDGHAGRVAHEVDELAAATGYAEVDVAHGIEHLARGLVGGGQQASPRL